MALSESQSDPQPHDHNPNQHNFDHLNAILPQPAHSVVVPESANMRACRRIQVSREKRPLHFYVTLSRKFLQTDEMVELSGLGLAVTTVVTVAEILKSQGLVHLENIETSLVDPHPEGHSSAPKAKIQIWIRRTSDFSTALGNAGLLPPLRPATTTTEEGGAASPSGTAVTPAPPQQAAESMETGSTNPLERAAQTKTLAPGAAHEGPVDRLAAGVRGD